MLAHPIASMSTGPSIGGAGGALTIFGVGCADLKDLRLMLGLSDSPE